MAGVASFHLVASSWQRAPLELARLALDRPALRRTSGLQFFRLCGTGRGQDTGPGADLTRTALFAVWDDDAALDAFVASRARRWATANEVYTVRLRGAGGHGTWRGFDVLAATTPSPPTDSNTPAAHAPVAIITRADVHLRAWRPFGHAGRPVSDELQSAPGLLAACGIGEAPIGRQGTFSLWTSMSAARAFARMPRHAATVRRTRAEGWYGEELFARFEPYASTGTWGGADPLRAARS